MDGGVEAAEKKNPLEDKRASDNSSAYNTNPAYSVIGWFLWGRGEARATKQSVKAGTKVLTFNDTL